MAALTGMARNWSHVNRPGFIVVSSTQPADPAAEGMFPRLLAEAVNGLPVAGYGPANLDLGAVVTRVPPAPNTRTIVSDVLPATITTSLPAWPATSEPDPCKPSAGSNAAAGRCSRTFDAA